ncbi:hypothetical protein [Halalkalibacter oceani]|uniref:hypothetical protein n=1 Tax=Halalkalibacter oceani TaxID=1653776 RepID=UPI0033936BD8
MLQYTLSQLNSKMLTELQSIARSLHLRRYTQLEREELIKLIYSKNPSAFTHDITYIYNEHLKMYSITWANYLDLTTHELTHSIVSSISNKKTYIKTHNKKEVKALYRAGFRISGRENLSEADTLEYAKNKAVTMLANTNKYNKIDLSINNDMYTHKIADNHYIIKVGAMSHNVETDSEGNLIFTFNKGAKSQYINNKGYLAIKIKGDIA